MVAIAKNSVGENNMSSNEKTGKNKMSRREFLGTAATAAAFTIVPRYVLVSYE